jgi:hypothetical protein
MPHPIQPVYTDQQTARTSAVLAAAGAWDASPSSLISPSYDFVTLLVTYTRGAAGGAVDLRPEVSLDGSAWYRLSTYQTAGVVAGVDNANAIQRDDYIRYGSSGAGAQRFVIGPLAMRGAVDYFRVSARESGVVGTPGTCEVLAVFNSTTPTAG